MNKGITILFLVTATALTAQNQERRSAGSAGSSTRLEPPPRLKEERIAIEYNATTARAALKVEAESEGALQVIELRTPFGEPVIQLSGDPGAPALQGFLIETLEVPLDELLGDCREGRYELQAWDGNGRPARGSARLSHVLPDVPLLLHPVEAAVVPSQGLVVRWIADSAAKGYRLSMEQGESDGIAVQLPAGTDSLRIPDGVLAPGTVTNVELGAVGENGNATIVEVTFVTL